MKKLELFFIQHRTKILIAGMMLFSLLVSVSVFLRQSLRLDEAQSLWQTSRTPAKILNIVGQDVHVPLYHMLIHYWQVFFGNTVMSVRLVSLLFFLISIPALYKLGKIAYGRKEGLFAALLLSISPFMNWYGNEVRMYSLFTFVCIVNQYCFLRLLRLKNGKRNKYWFWYGLTALLGIYTHYFFFFGLFTQLLFYLYNKNLFQKGDLGKFLKIFGILAIAFSPWIIYVITLGSANNSSPLLVSPTSVDVFNTFSHFIFGFQSDVVNTLLLSLWPIAVLFGFLGLKKREKMAHESLYFIAALIIPMVLAMVISIALRPLYLSRYLILSLPPLYLLISSFVYSLSGKTARIVQAIIAGSMFLMLMVQAMSAQTPVKENYREASAYLTEYARASDVIAVSAPFTIYPIDYYYNGPATIKTLPLWDRSSYGPIPAFNIETLPEEVAQITEGQRNLWLLVSYDQGYERDLVMYFDTNYQRLSAIKFSPKLNLYEYKIRYP